MLFWRITRAIGVIIYLAVMAWLIWMAVHVLARLMWAAVHELPEPVELVDIWGY